VPVIAENLIAFGMPFSLAITSLVGSPIIPALILSVRNLT
jgi:hypothetical protein